MLQKGIISVESCRKRQQPLKRDFAGVLHPGVSFVRIPVTSLSKNKPVNLCEPIICLNTHTHTHTFSTGASRYKISSKYQSVSRNYLSELSCLSSRNTSDKHHTSPVTIAATERGLCAFRRYAVHGYAMHVCRRNCLYAHPMSNTTVKPDYI